METWITEEAQWCEAVRLTDEAIRKHVATEAH